MSRESLFLLPKERKKGYNYKMRSQASLKIAFLLFIHHTVYSHERISYKRNQ